MFTESLSSHMLPAPRNGGFAMDDYWVWCGSVIKGEDNRYHMFASRWPKYMPMHPGWLAASEVVRASSNTPEGPYSFEEVVLPARGPEYWDGRMTHNPRIKKFGDTYYLYYTGSTHPFADVQPGDSLQINDALPIVARTNKRIGVAISKSVSAPWTRYDKPLMPTRPDKFDSLLTTNAAPCVQEDGSVLLIYKARAYVKPPYVGLLHGPMTIGVASAPAPDGPFTVLKDETVFPADVDIEDPYVWKTEDGYQLIAKDMNGSICGEMHGGIQAHSEDGVNWIMEKGKLAYSRKVLWDDGQWQTMGSLERPFILFEDGKPTHIFFATADGPGGFSNATRTWNMVIPLK